MNNLFSFQETKPSFGKNVYVAPMTYLVGDISIGDDASIWPMVAARGDVNFIKIGQRTNIQDGSVLHVTHKNAINPDGFPLIIGDDVTIGHKAMLHGCHIQDRVLIGMGSIVLDGVTIESDVMLGAGSLVPPNKTLASGYLYLGNPAKKIRELTQKEREFLLYSAQNYVRLKNEYLL